MPSSENAIITANYIYFILGTLFCLNIVYRRKRLSKLEIIQNMKFFNASLILLCKTHFNYNFSGEAFP